MVKNYNNKNISSLIQLEYSAFKEATVPICTFVFCNNFNKNYKGTYLKLSEFTGGMEVQKNKVLEIIENPVFFNDKNRYTIKQQKFTKIPGFPISYWVSENFLKTFEKGVSIGDISDFTGSQNITADNTKYLRYFWEVDKNTLNSKWIKYAKGGDYKKYYGNINLVVDWSLEARTFYKNNKTSNLLNKELWYKEGITYNAISSKGTGFRYLPKGCIFDKGGPSIVNVKNLYYCIGFLNTNIVKYYLNIFNPTLNIQIKDIKNIPIIINNNFKPQIEKLTINNIKLTKEDWDEQETSFDFKCHPLLLYNNNLIKFNHESNVINAKNRFEIVKSNENEINKIFIKIYGLNEVSSNVFDENVTLSIPDLEGNIKSFVSYAVGCMLGRYSLDDEGIVFAGGEFDLNRYHKFIPDDDNIIPILDTEYFEDDIVGRFVEFVKVCFGEETLEENLDFIAGALNKKGKSSREIIRNYFLKDFFKDHVKTYNKYPIYWQFDSGKKDGFKCLIYMHRYEPGLVARIRTDYLHKTEKAIEENITNCNNTIENSTIKSEINKANNLKNKLIKQLEEIKQYDEVLAHIANQKIEINLDDGVKVNYAKFQNIKLSKNKKTNLLKKI